MGNSIEFGSEPAPGGALQFADEEEVMISGASGDPCQSNIVDNIRLILALYPVRRIPRLVGEALGLRRGMLARRDLTVWLYIGRKLVKALMLLTSLGFLASAPNAPAQAQSSMLMTVEDAAIVRAVVSYVTETRGWPADSYRVDFNRRDGDLQSLFVVHKDDEAAWAVEPTLGGGGKSFAVDVDRKSLRVVRELAFQ